MTEKLRMVEKDGKKVPFYAADGVGKMQRGGMPETPRIKKRERKAGLFGPAPRSEAAMIRADRANKRFEDQFTTGRGGNRGRKAGRRQRNTMSDSIARSALELPTIGMRDAEGGAMMRQQFQQQDAAQKNPRRRSGPGMFGDRRLGGMFSGNRGRRGGLRQAQRAVMEGMGMRGPTGIREGGLVKIASEKSKAKTRKMERRGYGAARKP
jgi:hypothetical protein|tara:strand:- start:3799 stop:4425 length:627 start_codon:yes stop_codon:yes gene_type:complete